MSDDDPHNCYITVPRRKYVRAIVGGNFLDTLESVLEHLAASAKQ